MADFEIPSFLQNCDVDTIHERMLGMLPENIDKTEGGFVWDFTRPTALIASELLQYYAIEVMKLVFPQYSSGGFLDMLASMLQVTRRAASTATTTLTIEGLAGTAIAAGTVFCTESQNGNASIEFTADSDSTIGDGGSVEITVTAVEPGTASNVDVGTIVLMSSPINGVTSVTNTVRATGGTEEEDDESLRDRVIDAAEASDISYIGNDADYKRWAESVSGMGTAIVVSEWNGPESVKIICIDANGDPANATILNAVYNLIMSPSAPLERLAPPNTILTVVAPTIVQISISATVEMKDGYTTADLESVLQDSIGSYLKQSSEEKLIRYSRIYTIITDSGYVNDMSNLLVNNGTSNIVLQGEEYASVGSISLSE